MRTRADVVAWCAGRFVDEADVIEYWGERAAIREYCGGASRAVAEDQAFDDVVRFFGEA